MGPFRTAVVAIALLAPLLSTAAAADDDDVAHRIREGIEKHRKADLDVEVVDAAGRPVEGATVRVEMTRHAFGFGTCVRSDRLARKADEPDTRLYKDWIAKLFNRATLGNGHKWVWQARPDRRADADAATKWLRGQGLDVHGHAMIWASLKWKAMSDDVIEKLKGDDADKAVFVRKRSLEHIADVGARYRGQVVSWDVVNEPYSERDLQKVIDPDAPRGQEPILAEWFTAARKADPDAVLYLNDFHILVGDHKAQRDSYAGTIEALRKAGAPLGGIGMQAHYYNAGSRISQAEMLRRLDRFGQYGLPIHVSEFDTFGKGWGETAEQREKAQAEFFREFLMAFFSHPQAAAFTMWGFWDGQHWHDEAPLFRKDWTPKPALKVYQDLVLDQWWTRTTAATAANGRCRIRGFRGDYAVTATAGGGTASQSVRLVRDQTTVRLVLKPATAGEGD